ncbi:MAG: hypothetical protein LBL62_00850 [Planctomycetaceae bacterium]|jgi:hypothetical protein|nr:hypothetical protein [Planctomycetaceae bacterium]
MVNYLARALFRNSQTNGMIPNNELAAQQVSPILIFFTYSPDYFCEHKT